MKQTLFAFAALCLLAFAAFGQDGPKPPTISVNGTAEILVPPDEVVFTLDVTKRNKDLKIAKAEADVVLAKIIAVTKLYDLKPENVKTDRISVEAKYQSIRDPKNRIYDEDGDEIGTRVFLGYDASTRILIKLTDIKRFEGFYDDLMKTGVTEIDDVSFSSSKMIDFVKQARQQAMKAAFDKATAMATAIGQTIGKAISIAEVSSGDRSTYASNSNMSANVFTGPTVVTEQVATFSPGAIKISAQVAVVFILN